MPQQRSQEDVDAFLPLKPTPTGCPFFSHEPEETGATEDNPDRDPTGTDSCKDVTHLNLPTFNYLDSFYVVVLTRSV
jgi:hypothetical protein